MAQRLSTSPAYPSRQHISLRYSNPDVFSDDYAVESQQVLEGYQTALLGGDDVVPHTKVAETPRRSLSFQRTIERPLASSRRSRRSQRSDVQSSITSRLNGHSSSPSLNPARSMTSMSELSNVPSTAQRSSRTISTFGFPRSQSPYQGATGPSHPYGMYPQDIGLIRTPSMATTSTVRRPERSYSGPSGPTQPYGMYSQHTVPEDYLNTVAGLAPPNVAGFPGRGQDYQRRLGPDGEDADDLIGPDGYTEQLPPYSRYANGVPPKYSSGIASLRRSAPQPPILLPQDSQETLPSPQARDGVGMVNPFNDSTAQLSSTSNIAELASTPKDEGGHFKERVKEKSRTKVCCGLVPCWLFGVIILVVCLAVFLGGIIGGVVAHKRGEEKGRKEAAQGITATTPAPTATVTASFAPDAIPISSTPSGLPPLQTGTFQFTLGGPSLISNSCLTNPAQGSAWDCATGADLQIDISMAGTNAPAISLSYPTAPGAQIRYGAQPPVLHGSPVILSLNSDSSTPMRGPAWSFQQTYTKVVIVRQQDLPGPSASSKRSFLRRWFSDDDGFDDSASLFERDSLFTDSQWAKAGERPWYCYWNGTELEGFIFVTQKADDDATISASYPTAASTNAAMRAAPSATYQGRVKRQAPPSQPAFPNVLKVEERRSIYNPVQPYCQQMQVLYNQQLGFTVPGQDAPLTIQLTETEAPFQQKQQLPQDGGAVTATMSAAPSSLPRREFYEKRAPNPNAPSCHCQWVTGV